MHILVVGLNHKTAPVEVRERASVSDLELDGVLAQLRDTRTILESVVLSTCNRFEVYVVVSSVRAGEDFLQTWMSRRIGVMVEQLSQHLYMYQGEAAFKHLMRVTAGLDSMVVGETQILGQVRNAFLAASDVANTGALLNQLFRMAIQLGKRAQTETTIGQSAVSVSYAAVQLVRKIFGDLQGRRALVIGAGKMSQLTIQHLKSNGISDVVVANRTYDKACAVATEYACEVLPWDALEASLSKADIVISSTGASAFVVSANAVDRALRLRSYRPMVMIDIAVPRDIDPTAGQVKNVYLYDIDDLEGVVAANLAERERQAETVNKMIVEAFQAYLDWLAEQEVVPLISAIRDKGLAIQASVMESLERKLPNLTDRERQLLHKHTMSIVNQMLRDPIQNMKELALASGGAKHVQVFAELFGISPEQIANTQQLRTSDNREADVEPVAHPSGFADLVRQWGKSLFDDDSEVQDRKLHPVLR